uniref:ATP synthase F0 subunit 8 n=1 Tax=Nesophrosyne sp. 48 GMB-2012 TaxID=1224014 RepID=UPI0021821AD5|nr:ATP synthase F0 subunit 8 [Nesophrosyne sp. 48 GMB-2012]UVI59806.1 ATP synthase F0 subunit 8 [Nesophrosyne sp. 48 GMB-2012]
MPQMAPMWWTTMLLISVMSLMLMTMMNYFLCTKKIDLHKSTNSNKLMWKWY